MAGTMDSHDIAYIAGLFDGEGSIAIVKSDRSKFRPNPSPMWGLYVTITNQHLPVLRIIQEEFGGSLTRGLGAYKLAIQTKGAGRFLEAIQPYIRIKKQQLELALDFQRVRSSRVSRTRLSQEEMGLYDLYKDEMHKLNKQDSRAFHNKSDELLETLTSGVEGNQQPSVSNGLDVDTKVQRLMGEEPTNNPNTSIRHESEDIVRHSLETRRVENKESLPN